MKETIKNLAVLFLLVTLALSCGVTFSQFLSWLDLGLLVLVIFFELFLIWLLVAHVGSKVGFWAAPKPRGLLSWRPPATPSETTRRAESREPLPVIWAALGGAIFGLFSYALLVFVYRLVVQADFSIPAEVFESLKPTTKSGYGRVVAYVLILPMTILAGIVDSLDYFGWSYCVVAMFVGVVLGIRIRRHIKISPRTESLEIGRDIWPKKW